MVMIKYSSSNTQFNGLQLTNLRIYSYDVCEHNLKINYGMYRHALIIILWYIFKHLWILDIVHYHA